MGANPVSRVIAAIDNSDASEPVVIMAGAVGTALGASVEVLRVIEDDDETQRPVVRPGGPPVRVLSGEAAVVLSLVGATCIAADHPHGSAMPQAILAIICDGLRPPHADSSATPPA